MGKSNEELRAILDSKNAKCSKCGKELLIERAIETWAWKETAEQPSADFHEFHINPDKTVATSEGHGKKIEDISSMSMIKKHEKASEKEREIGKHGRVKNKKHEETSKEENAASNHGRT